MQKLSKFIVRKSYTLIIILSLFISACGTDKDKPLSISSSFSTLGTNNELDFENEKSSNPTLVKAEASLEAIYQRGEIGYFQGVDDCHIAYATLPIGQVQEPSLGALVILPGRTEPFAKYLELVSDLSNKGYDLFLMDHRGQGLSCRMLPDTEKGHVESFKDYIDDVRTMIEQIVKPTNPQKTFILAHSMGGNIATIYAEKHPETIDGLILSAPMHQIITDPYPEVIAYSIVWTATFFGLGGDYAIGKEPYDWNFKFEDCITTHSQQRFNAEMSIVKQNPSLAVGGPTNSWIKESLKATSKVRKNRNTKKLTMPVMIFQAGDDLYVHNSAQEEVCNEAAQCERHLFEGSYHEILMEQDSTRNRALDLISEFLLNN